MHYVMQSSSNCLRWQIKTASTLSRATNTKVLRWGREMGIANEQEILMCF